MTKLFFTTNNIPENECAGFIAHINGTQCKNSKSFFDNIWKALDFPYPEYKNWDGYLDWIRDLSWIQETAVTIIIDNYNDFLSEEPEYKECFIIDIQNTIFPYWTTEGLIVDNEEGYKNITIICNSKV